MTPPLISPTILETREQAREILGIMTPEQRQETIENLTAENARLRRKLGGRSKTMQVKKSELVAAFTEWDRRWREEPERFASEAQHLLRWTPKTYGDACGPYFEQILKEVKRKG